MELLSRLASLAQAVEQARSVPMSSNCMMHRGELLSALAGMRDAIPVEIAKAQQVIDEREHIVAAGRTEAERIVAEGAAERQRLTSMHEITLAAEQEAARIVEQAQAEAQRLRDEVEEYVDTSLANFEQLLGRTIDTVRLGRNRMNAVVGLEGGFEPQPQEKPLPF